MPLDKMYTEVVFDTPTIRTVPIAATPIYAQPFKYVFGFIIRVRSMGTATYVRIGNEAAQTYSLTVAGQTLEWTGRPGQVMDMAKLYTVSDTADAVLEIVAEYMPVRPTVQVIGTENKGR